MIQLEIPEYDNINKRVITTSAIFANTKIGEKVKCYFDEVSSRKDIDSLLTDVGVLTEFLNDNPKLKQLRLDLFAADKFFHERTVFGAVTDEERRLIEMKYTL